mmetsp:Transcript_38708/g.62947  ORF Transcript_38708/g.62947 Transcript_38708/m.62947 type:complete len:155 (+) Transcript_38708:2-466(+)
MAAGSPWKQLLRAGLTRPRSGCLRAAFSSGSEAKEIRRLKSSDIPSEAQAVVVGGGIIGCSVAYHLAEMGTDVVLLERDKITSGTTWHAAGLMVTFGSLSETSTEMRKYTKQLYQSLEAETGQSTGFKVNFDNSTTSFGTLPRFPSHLYAEPSR